MAEAQIRGKIKGGFSPKSACVGSSQLAPNLLDGQSNAGTGPAAWVGDIATRQGWLYLVVITADGDMLPGCRAGSVGWGQAPDWPGEAKEMVMSYPADAFVRVQSQTAPKGTLIYIRDIWVLSAEIDVPVGVKKKSLVLSGQNAGRIYDAIVGDNGIAPAPGVTVELRIADPTLRVADGTYPTPGAAVIPANGAPQIWVCQPNSEHDLTGFHLDGERVDGEEHEHRPFLYFKTYDVWLTRDGRDLSDKPLFTVR